MNRDDSGHCSSYSYQSRYALEPIGLPTCIARNPFGYQLNFCQPSAPVRQLDVNIGASARRQSLIYASGPQNGYIPNSLLQKSIAEDIQQRKLVEGIRQSQSTVLSVSHNDKHFLIHPTGQHLDSLTLKEASTLLSSYSDTDFLLKLSPGQQVKQVLSVGSGYNFHSSSHVLCRSSFEVFHTRLVSSDSFSHPNSNNSSRDTKGQCVLEPVQRWKFPCEVMDMSTSGAATWSFGWFLCANGHLMQWSVREGVSSCNTGKSVIHSLQSDTNNNNNYDSRIESMRVESSLHPQVCYVLFNSQMLLYDARRPGPAHTLYNSDSSSSGSGGGSLYAVKQLSCDANKVLLSGGLRYVSLLDVRCSPNTIAKKPLPEPHSMLKSRMMSNKDNSNTELILGAGSSSSHILSHCIELNGGNATGGSSDAKQGSHCYDFLSIASVLGTTFGNCLWSMSSFPVVDCSSHVNYHSNNNNKNSSSSGVSLTGFDIIPYSISNDNTTAMEIDTDYDRRAKECEEYLLVHQNSVGDVYAQKVSWGDNKTAIFLEARAADRATLTLSSNKLGSGLGSTPLTPTTPRSQTSYGNSYNSAVGAGRSLFASDLKGVIGAFATSSSKGKASFGSSRKLFSNDCDSDTSEDEYSQHSNRHTQSQLQQQLIKVQASDVNTAGGVSSGFGLAPLQNNLPCGVRGSRNNNEVSETNTAEDSEEDIIIRSSRGRGDRLRKSAKAKQKPARRPLLLSDNNYTAAGDCYPLRSDSQSKHQQKEMLLSFDVIRFTVSSARLDQPYFSLDCKSLKVTHRQRKVPKLLATSRTVQSHLINSHHRVSSNVLMMEAIVELVTDHPRTLYEISRFIAINSRAVSSRGGGVTVDVRALRECLTSSANSSEFSESVLTVPSDATADKKKYAVREPHPSSSRGDSGGCRCAVKVLRKYNKLPHASRQSTQRSAHSRSDSSNNRRSLRLLVNNSDNSDNDSEHYNSNSEDESGEPFDGLCDSADCVMAFSYVYCRKYTSKTIAGRTRAAASSIVNNNSQLYCSVYRANKVLPGEELAAEEDLFLTQQQSQQTQPTATSALAAAIGLSQPSSQFTHQSILNTQNTFNDIQQAAINKVSKRPKPSVSVEIIDALSKSWDSLII